MPRLSKRLSFIQASTELSSGLSRMLHGGAVQREKFRIVLVDFRVLKTPSLHHSSVGCAAPSSEFALKSVSGSVKWAWPQVVD